MPDSRAPNAWRSTIRCTTPSLARASAPMSPSTTAILCIGRIAATGDADIYFLTNQSRAAVRGQGEVPRTAAHPRTLGRRHGHQTTRQLLGRRSPHRGRTRSRLRGTRRSSCSGSRPSRRSSACPCRRRPVLETLDRTVEGEVPRRPRRARGSASARTALLDRTATCRASAITPAAPRYSRAFRLPARTAGTSSRVDLDLGAVGEMASVRLNGQDLGTWWSPPFRRDVTHALRGGENQLEIRVTNYWANRLIGDEQAGGAEIHVFNASTLPGRRTTAPLRIVGAGAPAGNIRCP